MFSRMYNNINLLEKSLDATWLKQETISQNIANNDTPGYDRKRVEFDDEFRAALMNSSNFQGKKTRGKHIDIGAASNPLNVTPRVVSDRHYTMRMDGNNVDIDQEMAEQAQNTLMYSALVTKLNKEFGRLRTVIKEGR